MLSLDAAAPTLPAPSSRGRVDAPLPSTLAEVPPPSSTLESVPVNSGKVTVPSTRPTIRARHLKPPKDSKVYKVAMAYVALRAQGMKMPEISETINVPVNTISTYVKRARSKGWLNLDSFTDPEDQIDYVLKSATVRNVETFLNNGDKEVTIEAAKGLGIFKNHQAVKVDGAVGVGFALKVDVTLPQGIEQRSPVTIRPGTIGGVPAVDAEVIESGEES